MKQTRRKELKTNDLSVYLQQTQEWIQQNATWLLVGVAAVVAILMIGLIVQQKRHEAMQTAWATYFTIREGDPVRQADLLERARKLALEQGDNGDLGPLALQLRGDIAYQLALNLTDAKDQARRTDLLREARNAYQQELDRFSSRQDARTRARMSIAAVDENLALLGDANADAIRKNYQQVIDDVDQGRPSAYQDLAREKLSDLDSRLQKLQIVATRPAASAPATSSAPVIQIKPAAH